MLTHIVLYLYSKNITLYYFNIKIYLNGVPL
ncbi:unnamed protein product [Spirodela intermedia]|uniref:Uncharacterized protein n=1 Tax=Spirodela intermedia TaxID=51605 RepID=A0A7I8L1W3_SPIIN|nr:unnamed protein product [Spirodela intermedia]